MFVVEFKIRTLLGKSAWKPIRLFPKGNLRKLMCNFDGLDVRIRRISAQEFHDIKPFMKRVRDEDGKTVYID